MAEKDATLKIKTEVSGLEKLDALASKLGTLDGALSAAGLGVAGLAGGIGGVLADQVTKAVGKIGELGAALFEAVKAGHEWNDRIGTSGPLIEKMVEASGHLATQQEALAIKTRLMAGAHKLNEQALTDVMRLAPTVARQFGIDLPTALDKFSTGWNMLSMRGLKPYIGDVQLAGDAEAKRTQILEALHTAAEKQGNAELSLTQKKAAAKNKLADAELKLEAAIARFGPIAQAFHYSEITAVERKALAYDGLRMAMEGWGALYDKYYGKGGSWAQAEAALAAANRGPMTAADYAKFAEAPAVRVRNTSRDEAMGWGLDLGDGTPRAGARYGGERAPDRQPRRGGAGGKSQAQWEFDESMKRSELMEKQDNARLERNEKLMAADELDELKRAARGLTEEFEGLGKRVEMEKEEGQQRFERAQRSRGVYSEKAQGEWWSQGGGQQMLAGGESTDGGMFSKGLGGMETAARKQILFDASLDKTGGRMKQLTAATREFDSQLTGLASGALTNAYGGIMNLADAAIQGKGNLGEMALALLKGTAMSLSTNLLGMGIASQIEATAWGLTPWTAWMVPFAEARAATFFTGAALFGVGGLALSGIQAAVGGGAGAGAGASVGSAAGDAAGGYRPSYGSVERPDARPIVLNVFIGGRDDLGAIPYARRQIASDLAKAA